MNIKQKKFWNKNGYLILDNVLSERKCKKIKDIIEKLAKWERKKGNAHIYDHDPSYTSGYRSKKIKNGKLQRIWNIINKHEIFIELIENKKVIKIMEELFYRKTKHHKFVLSSFQANIIGAGGKEQRLHVDTPIPEPFPDWIMQANSIWAIDDFTKNNGATWCLPGSHKFKKKPRMKDQSRKDLKQFIVKKGSVIITHGLLWHKSGENYSDQSRIGLLGSFSASFLRDLSNEENYLSVIDRKTINNSSDFLKKLIGDGHGIHKGSKQKPPIWKK